jgi:hypothetical protein
VKARRTPYFDTSTGFEQKLDDMSAMRIPLMLGSDCRRQSQEA